MRYDEDHKQRTREKVLKAAARTIRAEGPDRVGVAGIMAEAGLTHGGFYAHFGSKDELVTEAVRKMFVDAGDRRRFALTDRTPVEALRFYIKFYVSREHRDERGLGCPLAALATDVPRLPEAARKVFGDGVQVLTDGLAEMLKAIAWPSPEEAASALLSQMAGAVSLARSVADRAQSDRILLNARADILRRFGLDEPK